MTFKLKPIPSSEITPREVYMRRREFLGGALAVAALGGFAGGRRCRAAHLLEERLFHERAAYPEDGYYELQQLL